MLLLIKVTLSCIDDQSVNEPYSEFVYKPPTIENEHQFVMPVLISLLLFRSRCCFFFPSYNQQIKYEHCSHFIC